MPKQEESTIIIEEPKSKQQESLVEDGIDIEGLSDGELELPRNTVL